MADIGGDAQVTLARWSIRADRWGRMAVGASPTTSEHDRVTAEHEQCRTVTGAWTRIPDVRFGATRPRCAVRRSSAPLHVSLGYAGDLQLELIQPVARPDDPRGVPRARTGRGCTTSASTVEDVDAACAAAEAAGVPVLMRGSMMDGEIEFAYVDGSAGGSAVRRAGPDRPADAGVLRRGEGARSGERGPGRGGHRGRDRLAGRGDRVRRCASSGSGC